ncbi:MAG TPA: T9SS type A sorting domain-containing protein, partial [Saprospiraceae bacterium]|nr:T9SS type A sorting domain-containing protein [Saprospiraceae bacterium]
RKIDLGFDITTSTQNDQVISRPLVIVPTPSQGWVSISIPDELNSIQRVEVLDITGKEIPSEISLDGTDITLRLNNPMPGMYLVRLVSGRFNYIGKMIVE